jgi:hypothetical protein
MHNISNLYYFWNTTCFRRSFRPSSGVLRLYIQHQVYVVQVLWLLASGKEMELSSISFPLASSHRSCMTYTWCCMYSLKLLMMDGETVRNMQSVVPKQNKFEILCIWLVLLQKLRNICYKSWDEKDMRPHTEMRWFPQTTILPNFSAPKTNFQMEAFLVRRNLTQNYGNIFFCHSLVCHKTSEYC